MKNSFKNIVFIVFPRPTLWILNSIKNWSAALYWMNFLVKWSHGGILKFIMQSLFFVTRIFSQFVNSCLVDASKPSKYPNNKNQDRIINIEIPPDHLTKNFILNPVEGSRSTPAGIPNSQQSVMDLQWNDVSESALHILKYISYYKTITIIYRTSRLETS